MESFQEIDELLVHITDELNQIRKMTIGHMTVDKIKAERAWNDLMEVSRQISKEWKGPTALEEIQSQREKEW
ncbi:MAG: hypothetical protein KKD69_05025 [Euryarchaeota archaeon]|nr:hypothetical protein [Euryarchaeota archaeon]MBU4491808.1 hypothetical protein [Euryarchaeota archaeon]MCG2727120.1 hypothetical protein [Candidatus Methanoperedenaceae archaeon]MDP2846125.1 hypothetical protein [Candidatus Methanoperedens sp.]